MEALINQYHPKKCRELRKETLRAFTLQYLALGALLNCTLRVSDSENKIQENKKLFETEIYQNLLRNFQYNTFANKTIIEKINSVKCETEICGVSTVHADLLYQHFSQQMKTRSSSFESGIEIVEPWCKCHPTIRCDECLDICIEKKRLKNGHYSSCDQFHY